MPTMPTVPPKARHIFFSTISFLLVIALSSCASMPTQPEGESEQLAAAPASAATPPSGAAAPKKEDAVAKEIAANPVPKSDQAAEKTEEEKVAEKASDSKSADNVENLTIGDVIRIEEPNTATLYDNSRYDFPITVNSRVEGWIDYFTGKGRVHMERYLGRSSRYMPAMREILKKNGLPEDLVFLALIESGFNMKARSHARAVGPWQFIKGTGQRYGLRVNQWIDERRDWIRSTDAAAKYLKDLYLMFESWYLAASAYNAGENKILRAIETVNTHNFWRICQTHALRRETKDYIPKLIAAAIIAKNPAKYGFADVAYEKPLEFDTVTIDFPVSIKTIATLIDAPEDDLLDLNPELAHGVVPPGAGPMDLRVPQGTQVVVERALASLKTTGDTVGSLPLQYSVRSGENLRIIARKYHMRVNDLAAANNLSPKERLRPGTQLVIPNRTVTSTTATNSARTSRSSATVKKALAETTDAGPGSPPFTVHVVRRGESLWSISEKYRVTIQELFRWNNLKHSKIYPGRRLKIKSDRESRDETTANYPVGGRKKG
jgi:membrane-bound lytic murein transglycosylase D